MSPTLVAFHAHPDDESIFTGGILVRAARSGWRTVVVLATSGEAGSTPGYRIGNTGVHRQREAARACAELGVDRLEFLPYRDSGNARLGGAAASSLAAAPVDEVVAQLEDVLADEEPTVLTTYDRHGVYRHRDHVAVHLAGRALADRGLPVYEATIDRHHLHELRDGLVGRRALAPWVWPADLNARLGSVDDGRSLLHLEVDASHELPAKLAAIGAHGSQVAYAPEFMGIPPGAFSRLLRHEWYRIAGPARAPHFELLVATAPRTAVSHAV